jgi:two-component system response regulator HydG
MTSATALSYRRCCGLGISGCAGYNGVQALEQVRQQVFDLVLCDIRMAEMDGIETLKEIKTLNPSIPVLIMTAYSSVDTAVEALKSGALDYLIKPLDFDKCSRRCPGVGAHAAERVPRVAPRRSLAWLAIARRCRRC